MSTMTSSTTPARMTGAQRRDQILRAARHVFAESGYAGSTDEVARAVGVSQPYVVRLFGTKRDLFVAAYRQTSEEVVAAFADVPPGPGAGDAMARAYAELLRDRDLLRLLMHGFIAGSDDEVGRIARSTLGTVFALFRERTGATEDEARRFVAQGMLINVLVAVDALDHVGEDPHFDGLVDCALGGADDPGTLTRP